MSFLKGSLVTMADGSKKKIEDIKVGEIVRDGQGINSFVRGKANLKYNPTFYNTKINKFENPIKINNEIVCMKDQHFLGADGNFYVLNGEENELNLNPDYLNVNYIVEYDCILTYTNYIIKNKIKNLQIGSIIMKDTGPVEVNSIDHLPPLQLSLPKKNVWEEFYYNNNDITEGLDMNDYVEIRDDIFKHKLGYRGTYIVDGYICLASPNHFWDYANDCLDQNHETSVVKFEVVDGFVRK